jgi:hypothetical protein
MDKFLQPGPGKLKAKNGIMWLFKRIFRKLNRKVLNYTSEKSKNFMQHLFVKKKLLIPEIFFCNKAETRHMQPSAKTQLIQNKHN